MPRSIHITYFIVATKTSSACDYSWEHVGLINLRVLELFLNLLLKTKQLFLHFGVDVRGSAWTCTLRKLLRIRQVTIETSSAGERGNHRAVKLFRICDRVDQLTATSLSTVSDCLRWQRWLLFK